MVLSWFNNTSSCPKILRNPAKKLVMPISRFLVGDTILSNLNEFFVTRLTAAYILKKVSAFFFTNMKFPFFSLFWNFTEFFAKIDLPVKNFTTFKEILSFFRRKFQILFSKKKRRHFFQKVSCGKPRDEKFGQIWKFL